MTKSAADHTTPRFQRRETPVVVRATGTALLLIDVINDLAFEGSDGLVGQAEQMAVALGLLKRRAVATGVPAIYINDNFGQWRSDFRRTVAHCTARQSPGRRVSQRLRPTRRDYFVLKPKHSGFFDTTLDTLLETLHIRRVILTGIAGNICVLFTANDAYMREYTIFAPRSVHRVGMWRQWVLPVRAGRGILVANHEVEQVRCVGRQCVLTRGVATRRWRGRGRRAKEMSGIAMRPQRERLSCPIVSC